ncbi:MAG: hypothetical protein AAFR27_11415, partial [Pseudomonadota bacterium]
MRKIRRAAAFAIIVAVAAISALAIYRTEPNDSRTNDVCALGREVKRSRCSQVAAGGLSKNRDP